MSSKLQNKQWIYVKRPEAEVTEEHYKLVQSEVPTPNEGEILIEALYFSVDPYMRIQQSALNTWEQPHPLNIVQGGGAVGKVIQSKDTTNNIKEGDIVLTYTGWQTYAVIKANQATKVPIEYDINGKPLWPISYSLGILGMPGRTAYFGLLDIGKPKHGETVVVSGAAGAVGSIVVQLAKIHGCRVVAIAGSDEKCDHLVQKLGADAAINYKKHPDAPRMKEALKEACPQGVDVYFDNTGGYITDAIFDLINFRARIIICGQISQYNGALDAPELAPRFLHKILYTRATIQGVLARDFISRIPEMMPPMIQWLKEGKLKYDETVVEGFENLPKALNSLFHGLNTGKLVVKA